MKYEGSFIFATLHCWGIFVFISQFPLVTNAARRRGLSGSLLHKLCFCIHSSNCAITSSNGIAVSCQTL
ncbi:hypothetical protein HanXRQr2_Chr03g0115281 [Helianthus annuus]|uniref:Uncharacterized protein n=1 Tax=Helianthus annuus TaxID=4232 RepID=A0A9K3NXA9_HELAN|nr:hypothetical protein HanXRQr2_Chr03g0115281 [Helianthus annuus]KAJ0944045.1 hypothetical protein HanPSC8_Chr03g0111701 [Helianthus annuus]